MPWKTFAIGALFLCAIRAIGQSLPPGKPPAGSTSEHKQPLSIPTHQDLLQRVEVLQNRIAQTERANGSRLELASSYEQLGHAYADLAVYPRAETTLRRAAILFRSAGLPDVEADALNDLGSLYMTEGRLRQAEREELQALKLRKRVGDPLPVAQSWATLATLYVKEGKAARAVEFAEQALPALSRDSVDPVDRIGVRLTLSDALCAQGDPARAVPVTKEAIALAQASYGPDTFPVGLSSFLLGFEFWKMGDLETAGHWMSAGLSGMRHDLGWGHPAYLGALLRYSQFLHERGRTDEAAAAERELHEVRNVVDARTLALH